MADKIPPVPSVFALQSLRVVSGPRGLDPLLYQTYASSLVLFFKEERIRDEERKKKFSVRQKKWLKKRNGVEKIEAFVRSRLKS